jgi:hypothetical protein
VSDQFQLAHMKLGDPQRLPVVGCVLDEVEVIA